MCGIWFCLGKVGTLYKADHLVKELEARGPEGTKIVDLSGCTLGFTRLAINGLNPLGMQPFKKEGLTWMCNGEIYNWLQISRAYSFDNQSGSDCEVLGDLYKANSENLTSFFRALDGVFALVIVDEEEGKVIVGRDPYGVRPLYKGFNASNSVFFASEIKSLSLCNSVEPFLPGTYEVWDLQTKNMLEHKRYHDVPWLTNPLYTRIHPTGLELASMGLRFALEVAVEKRLLTERPVAALLSGGIDSSLIASLVQKNLKSLGLPPLKTFSIGMKGSADLFYAKKVADFIRSDHTEIVLTADDFFNAIPEVISAIETFDTTTVRASVGNWLVSREIKKRTDCKVVFNGDGSDEVFGSYLYFYNAPSEALFEEESSRLLKDIHYFDVLRSDRSISSHGLEPRTPFLDKQFVSVARSIDSKWRRPVKDQQVEKWILRRAFDDGVTLPKDVLWRRKEAFSDGVSGTEKSWYEEIQQRVTGKIPENWATKQFDHLPPQTEEQYYYRMLYLYQFGPSALKCVPYFWMPKWSPGATDPSARTLALYTIDV